MSHTGEMQQRGQFDSHRPRSQGSKSVGPLALVAFIALASCSSSGGGEIGAPPSVADSSAESIDTGPDFVPTPAGSLERDGGDATGDSADGTGEGSPTTEFDLEAQPSTPAIDPIPETGVPGMDSANAFCRAWSEFSGSFQALGLTSAVGDPARAYRLEVVAASSVTTAVETMEANLPAELESERSALIADFAGPFFTRALLAEIELLAAGVDPELLRDVWLTTLAEAGVDDPEIVVVTPVGVDTAALDDAVAAFASAQPAIVGDPTLVTTASIPATEAYLAEVCPDGGTLSGNDVIGS